MKGLSLRITVVIFCIVFAFYLLIPTVLKYQYGTQVSRTKKADDPWYFSLLTSDVLRLGLDLVGGLHLVLGIDFDEVRRDAVLKLKNQIKELAEREKIDGLTYDVTNDYTVVVKFSDESKWKALDSKIGSELGQYVDFVSQSKDTATLRMSSQNESDTRLGAINQSLETLRNRIDEFGIAEPIIQRQGDEKILVQFPGVQETGRLKEIISRTAKLSMQVVRSGPEAPDGPPAEDDLKSWIDEFQKTKNVKPDATKPISEYLREINLYLQAKIPQGTEIRFHKELNVNTRDHEYIPYLLERENIATGEDLQDAYIGWDDQGRPLVNFQLTPMGATKFEKGTGENVGRFMAIVLDNNVHSAPRIKTKIGGGRAQIEMGSSGRGRDEVYNDAKDTALVLRSGALPARLLFLEERTIGPSLGRDSIKAGTTSLMLGLLAVFVFMSIYYKGSGLVAVGVLLLNGLFIFAAMAAFDGTLTLPGLAGITLTLGMAVDANVLIFEHMREELRNGKTIATAIAEGYKRAFTAILDSNLTTIIAGIVLLQFGYGAIRGFAVTMLIGLVVSMFTAVFCTRVFYDYYIISKSRKTISL